ncbi:MAG: magnesium transporter [Bacteroidetes bacterium]|nr:magnesium transporter [Bacteroidota bacterium]
MKEFREFELNKEYIDRFQEALDQRDREFVLASLESVNPADISALLYEFNSEESKWVLDLLEPDVHAQILKDLDSDTRKNFLRIYKVSELTGLINLLDSDDAADILNELPIKNSEEVIAGLDLQLRSQVIDLLRYDENVAGGLMAKELIKVRDHWSVVQCIQEVRSQAEHVTKFYTAYVVDDQDRLLGRISLQDLIIRDSKTLVRDILEEVVAVETFMEDREVAEVMKKYDYESVPVVNVQGILVGRITIDDVVDVITEQAEEDRQAMAGISEDVEEDDTVWRNTRARLPWLLVGVAGGLISARFMGFFEGELSRIAAISFFIPLIQATGGNVGIQSSSLVVQSLSAERYQETLRNRLARVFSVALLNGFLLALAVLAVNIFLFENDRLSGIVSVALFAVVVFASFIGTITPLILHRMGYNPALASGPFITTTNDLLGLAVYFSTVHVLL